MFINQSSSPSNRSLSGACADMVACIVGVDGVCVPPEAGAAGGADGEDPTNTTVFVGGIDATITEEILRESFAPFGEVETHAGRVYIHVHMGRTGCPSIPLLASRLRERTERLAA